MNAPAWVAEYLPIPFRSEGRTKEGADCYGLIRLVLAEHFGKWLPLLEGYADALDKPVISGLIDRYRPLLAGHPLAFPEVGSIAVLRYSGWHCHIGLVAASGWILHTDRPTGVVCQRLTDSRLRGRIEGFYRVD